MQPILIARFADSFDSLRDRSYMNCLSWVYSPFPYNVERIYLSTAWPRERSNQ